MVLPSSFFGLVGLLVKLFAFTKGSPFILLLFCNKMEVIETRKAHPSTFVGASLLQDQKMYFQRDC